jgi:iron complex outermembrane recepter protein
MSNKRSHNTNNPTPTIMKKQQAKGSGIKRLALSVTFLASSLAPLTTYGADGVLRGRVTDKADGEGVIGAAVSIAGTNIATATDIDGNFVLRHVPPAQQKVTVSSVGYAPTTQVIAVGDGQTATLNFALGQTTIMASEVVVGAALYKQDRLSIPVTANVVSKDEIKKAPNPTLADAVENVPGVNVSRSAGNGTSTLQIRGSNAFQGGAIGTRVQGTYDGFPINNPTTGEIAWSNMNMNSAERIEVLKGAAATLYGSGAMGGVMNVYGALPDKFEVNAGYSMGFYDTPPKSDNSTYRSGNTPLFWNSYAGFGNKSGKWNYSLLFSHTQDDGFKANSSNKINDLKFKAKYSIDSRQYIQLTSFYNQTEGGYSSMWPQDANRLAILSHRYDAIDYASATPTSYDDTISRKNALVGLNYVNLLSDSFSIDTKVYYTRNESKVQYNLSNTNQRATYFYPYNAPVYALSPKDRMPGEFNQDISDRVGAGIKLDWKANNQNRVLFGIDVNTNYVRSTQYTGAVPDAHPMSDSALHDIREKNFAAFLQDEYKPTEKLTFLGSVRYDWSGIDTTTISYIDYSNPTATFVPFPTPGFTMYVSPTAVKQVPIVNKSVSAISPRLAANFKAAEDLSFRASWGKSFRAPSLAERFVRDAGLWPGNPNPALDKETMTAYELGMFKQFGDKVSLDVAGFVNNYHNLIQSALIPASIPPLVVVIPPNPPTIVNPGSYFVYSNVQNARIWGIESSLNIKPIKEVKVTLGYTFLNAKDVSNNTWLPGRPEHTAFAGINWTATKVISCLADVRYMSKVKSTISLASGDITAYPGDFVLLNLGAKAKLSKNISATLNCKNVFNTMYSESEGYPAPGRTFIAGIDLSY